MLVIPSAKLAIARFPKTAGTSLGALILESFPDARYVDPSDAHVDVAGSLCRFRHRSSPLIRLARRLRGRPLTICDVCVPDPLALRVIGVVREPFEMAVSLFEYWHSCLGERDKDHSALMTAAYQGDYLGFMRLISSDISRFPTYLQFYDFGGPLWPNTALVDFAYLREGLDQAFASFGVRVDLGRLPFRNQSRRPEGHMRLREAEAGPLASSIRQRYALGPSVKVLGRA